MQINYLKIEITPSHYDDGRNSFYMEVISGNKTFTIQKDYRFHDFKSVFDLMLDSAKEEILRMVEKEDVKK